MKTILLPFTTDKIHTFIYNDSLNNFSFKETNRFLPNPKLSIPITLDYVSHAQTSQLSSLPNVHNEASSGAVTFKTCWVSFWWTSQPAFEVFPATIPKFLWTHWFGLLRGGQGEWRRLRHLETERWAF